MREGNSPPARSTVESETQTGPFARDRMRAGTTPSAEDQSDDAALLARIAVRDEAAFRQVIGAHAALLHRIAYRMTGDAHEAEDIAQEAMLRLWDHAPKPEARRGQSGLRPAEAAQAQFRRGGTRARGRGTARR